MSRDICSPVAALGTGLLPAPGDGGVADAKLPEHLRQVGRHRGHLVGAQAAADVLFERVVEDGDDGDGHVTAVISDFDKLVWVVWVSSAPYKTALLEGVKELRRLDVAYQESLLNLTSVKTPIG